MKKLVTPLARRGASTASRQHSTKNYNSFLSLHEHYFESVDDLAYLYSPQGLMSRADLSLDIANDLFAKATSTNDAIDALETIDTMNNTLCLVLDPCEATRSTHPGEHYRRAATDSFTKVFQCMSEMNASRELYDGLVACFEPATWAKLTPVQQRNASIMKDDMDANGIHLPQREREYVVQLHADKERLAHELITSQGGRQQQVLDELIKTRHTLAQCLGADSFAHHALTPTMAETPEKAWAFINSVSARLQDKSKHELDVLMQVKRAAMRGQAASPVKDYEVDELSQLHQHSVYGEALGRLREYLSAANVWRGLQLICERLFNITVDRAAMEPHERYHPTVQKYVLHEKRADGKQGAMIGTIYADLLQRPDKMPGAGHYTVQLGTTLHKKVLESVDVNVPNGGKQLPVVIFSCNTSAEGVKDSSYSSSEDFWEEVLLSPDEMVTLFHEFGHALHSAFGQTEQQNLAGTRASLDYVETFSQLMEYYAKDYRVLKEFAFHYKTREPVPEDLVHKLNESEYSFCATSKLNQLILAAADLVFHGTRPLSYVNTSGIVTQLPSSDVLPTLKSIHTPTLGTQTGMDGRAFSLMHMSNYPAAYYSYAYSRVCAWFPLPPHSHNTTHTHR